MKRALVLLALSLPLLEAQAIRTNPAFRASVVPRNDDGSSDLQQLGFTANFFGRIRSHAYVNNNGNITFDSALSTFTPFGLEGTRREIIAPFFADVDTRPLGSALVTYGRDTIDGRPAFGVNYINVGYFANHVDKLNSFQLVLIQRDDTGFGNFDIEFNYERIVWETGDASGGVGGLGGTPAAAGWSNGTGEIGTSFELEGSLVSGAFLDGGSRSLARNRLNSPLRGRYLFRARGGRIIPPLTLLTGCPLPTAQLSTPYTFQFQADGTGTNNRYTWVADPGVSLPPGLNLTSNGLLAGTPTAAGTTEFTVRLTSTLEDGEQTVTRRCSLTVEPPRLSIISACPLPAATAGQRYSRTLQVSGGRGPYVWSLAEDSLPLPPGVVISSAGTVSGTPTAEGIYRVTFRVAGNPADGSEPATRACVLTVNPALLNISASCSLPPAVAGVPYSQSLEVEGGSAPFRWSAAGPIPAGLTLHPDGRITGSALEAGTSSFEVRVSDREGRQVSQSCTLQVDNPVLTLATSCPLPSATTGEPYSENLEAAGGDAPYTFAMMNGLPNGLSLSSEGALSGVPGAAGAFGLRMLITDSKGRTAVRGCTISVFRAEFSLTSCPLTEAIAGTPYSRFLTADGGFPPYTFTPAALLPPGLSLTTTGHLNGRPERAGTYPVRVNILDRSGRGVTHVCNLTVAPSTLEIAGECPAPSARVGTAYNTRYTARGGSDPYSFLSLDPLPPGLSLMSGGSITGTPASASAARNFRIGVTDGQGRFTTRACSIDVKLPDPPSVRIATLPASTAAAATGPTVVVELATPYSIPVQGTLNLTVEPTTGSAIAQVNQSDPRVRFANGQRSINFTFAPGQRQQSFTIASTGTVASTVTVSVSNLRAGGTNLVLSPSPRVFTVRRGVPVITDACFQTRDNGIQAVVTGYSTTRDLRRAQINLTPESGTPQNNILDVSGTAADYFSTDESIRNGGAFTLTIPFQIVGSNVTSATLVLSNSEGAAASRTLNRCQ